MTNQSRNKGYREANGLFQASEDEGEANNRRFTLSFSSEEPCDRWFGPEILSHSDGAVDMSRLTDIGVVLYNHNRDAVIGKVVRAWTEDGRGQAEIEFDDDEQSEVIRQKVASKTLKGVSVGYMVNEWDDVRAGERSKDGRFEGPCAVATRWTPFEISIVSIPADATVGVGREMEDPDGMSETLLRQLQYNNNLYGR